MQGEYFQQWSILCKKLAQPITDLTELNTKTMHHFCENNQNIINQLTTCKKPEDVLNVQAKLTMEANACIMNYCQEASNIIKNAVSKLTEHCQKTVDEHTNK